MSGYLFDSNVLIDIATRDPVWQLWSATQLGAATTRGLAYINPIIYTEVARPFLERQGRGFILA